LLRSLATASGLCWILAVPQAAGGAAEEPTASDPATWASYALDESHAAAQSIADPYYRSEALVRIAALNTGFNDIDATRGSLREAREAALQIRTAPGHDLALRNIGLEWVRIRDIDAALDVAEAIDSQDLRAAVVGAVGAAQLAAGDFAGATVNAHRLPSTTATDQALRRIAQAQAHNNRITDARASVAAIQDDSTRAIAAADVAGALADVDNSDSLARALSLVRAIRSKSERDAAYVYIALIQGQSGDFNAALSSLGRVKDPALRALGFARLATMRAQAQDATHAAALLTRATTEIRTPGATRTRTLALSEIAVAQITMGEREAARATLQEALRNEAARGPREGNQGLEALARLQARAGDIPGALANAVRIADEATRGLLIHDIAAAQAESGDRSGARATAEGLESARLQVPAWFGIIGVQIAAGDRVGASESLQAAAQRARAIDDTEYRTQSLAAIAAAHVKLGDVTTGWARYQEARAAAQSLEPGVARAAAFANLADPFRDQ
jgi:hypothetical protein